MAIKNILFDLDETLIKNQEEDVLCYKEALSNLGYPEENYKNIFDSLDEYEKSLDNEHNFYSKRDAINFINKTLNENYPINLIDELNNVIAKYWCKYPLIQESTLKYLSSKYNLYVFSNWFKDAQLGRLETAGLAKYFKNIFTPEYYGAKPFKSSYINVLNFLNCSPDECVMIGDNKATDILGAINVGMHAILFDYDRKRNNPDILIDGNYSIITDMKDLEKIL